MSSIRTKVGAGVTVAALGGLSAVALASESPDATPSAPKRQAVEVRTQVETRTIHRTKHVKPRPAAAAPSAPAAPPVSAAGNSGPSSSAGPSSPVPVPSGGSDDSGRGEIEPGDDHGGRGGHGGDDD